MKKVVFVFFVSISINFISIAVAKAENEKRIDSLQTALKKIRAAKSNNSVTSLSDTVTAKILIQLADLNIYNDPDTSFLFAEQALVLCQNIGYIKGIADCYNAMGIVNKEMGNYLIALDFHKKALKIRITIKDKMGIGSSYSNIGVVYKEQDNYQEALKYYFLSFSRKLEINDKRGISTAFINIGNIYRRQNEISKAKLYYLTALKIKEEIKENKSIAGCYLSLGLVYVAQNNYPKALAYYLKSLRISEEIKDKRGIASAYNNIGVVYRRQSNYQEALKMQFASLKIKQDLKDKRGIGLAYGNIGTAYYDLKMFDKSITYQNLRLDMAKKTGSWELFKLGYQTLAAIDSATGNYKAAVLHYELYKKYQDSIADQENTRKTAQAQMQYEYNKKEELAKLEQEKKDALAKNEIEIQRLVRNSFIGGFILILLLVIGIFRSLQQDRIAKIAIGKQKELVEQKNKEIIASIEYAKRLQNAILPSTKLVKEYLVDSFIFYRPKDIVAGDFYWFYPTKNKLNQSLILFAAADCTGHGVPGAMLSVVCANALNNAVKELHLLEPGKILDAVNDFVEETFVQKNSTHEDDVKDGMDISLCALNIDTLELHWSGANNPLVIIRNVIHSASEKSGLDAQELKPNKQPIGLYSNRQSFITQRIQLQKGEMIYSFSDGYADQFGGVYGKKLMKKNLLQHLLEIAFLPVENQKEKLEILFDKWKGSNAQVDDVCLIGVRV